jgi:hypothetical protein
MGLMSWKQLSSGSENVAIHPSGSSPGGYGAIAHDEREPPEECRMAAAVMTGR